MKESEYIDVRDLERVERMKSALIDITPSISSIIKEKEYNKIAKILNDWQTKLYKKINID